MSLAVSADAPEWIWDFHKQTAIPPKKWTSPTPVRTVIVADDNERLSDALENAVDDWPAQRRPVVLWITNARRVLQNCTQSLRYLLHRVHVLRIVFANCDIALVEALQFLKSLRHNRTVVCVEFQQVIQPLSPGQPVWDALEDLRHYNPVIRQFIYGSYAHNNSLMIIGKQSLKLNRKIGYLYSQIECMPALGDARGASGEFDVLPNEMLCAVARRVWPSREAVVFSWVCRRARDCMLSDYVVQQRMGVGRDGTRTRGDPSLLWRAALEDDELPYDGGNNSSE
jgi:hypothetical protein